MATRGGTITTVERERIAINMRKEGKTGEEIAAALGLTHRGSALKIAKRAIKKSIKQCSEDASEVYHLELLRIDELFSVSYPLAKKGEIKYIEICLKLMKRRAELMGLDAPQKMDIGGEAMQSLSDWVRFVTENASKQ